MIWLGIGGILLVISIIFLVKAFCDYDFEDFGWKALVFFVFFALTLGGWFGVWYDWQVKIDELRSADVYFANEAQKIEAMRKTYYPSKTNIQLTDSVNAKLSQQINNAIQKLADDMADYNSFIFKWRRAYKNKLFSACFTKPDVELFDLRKYVKE